MNKKATKLCFLLYIKCNAYYRISIITENIWKTEEGVNGL